MIDIKPDEISAILRQQLSNFNTSAELEEVGSVLQVGDGIARIYGLNNVKSGELVEFENGVKAIALNLEEDNVGVVLMGDGAGIKEGSKVKRTGMIASIKAGMGLVGRVINTLGEAIDAALPVARSLSAFPCAGCWRIGGVSGPHVAWVSRSKFCRTRINPHWRGHARPHARGAWPL
jgi:F-type H+-transporting ATPase subunit alpha